MVWSYPLTKVDGQAITPGSIVCCLVLLWFGYVTARVIAWWVGSRFLPRLGVHPTAIVPMQTICHYVLLGSFTMLSLRLANVPLTAFTFLGGAIAIGVGFGSQTVMNNFISGLILLAERPVRVGDIIEIDGQAGKVTKIGPRSTHLHTSTNLVIVLPNSKLLEGTLINWTLTDDSIRTKIVCGVAYGSRTRDVERWLLEAARRKEEVLQEPAPFVIFSEFGDNALIFELHFWISLTEGHNRVEVESELRFEIDDLFRTAGIVMAYPQRDIHLNVMRPVDVRMIGAERNERPASRAA
jgi:small-conductance mechanosensitive channel